MLVIFNQGPIMKKKKTLFAAGKSNRIESDENESTQQYKS